MALSTPAQRMAAGALLLLTLLLPSVSAQAPALPVHPQESTLAIAVICPMSYLAVDYNSQAEVTCTLEDLSRDSVFLPGSGSGTSVSSHTVTLTTRDYVPENGTGWQVILSRALVPMYGGDVVPFTVNVKATPLITTQALSFTLDAVYSGPNGYTTNVSIPFVAEVNQYDVADVRMKDGQSVRKAGQDDIVTYEVSISNLGVFPDVYRLSAKSDPDIKVSAPGSVYVGPGETRVVTVSVLTPHGKVYEVGRSTLVNIKVTSGTGSGSYSTVGVLQIRGPYVPVYWIPLLLVGVVSAGVVAGRTRERTALARAEKGLPRRVQPTPRQAVLLAELKRTDPEAYKARKAQLDAIYAARRTEYAAHRKERLAKDKEESRQARLEFKAARRKQKAEEKAQRKQAAIDAKAERKQAKIDAKLARAKEKQIAKKRKELEKAKKKAAKAQARIDAKQAKIDAKNAKREAAEQKRAAKLAAKAERKKGKP